MIKTFEAILTIKHLESSVNKINDLEKIITKYYLEEYFGFDIQIKFVEIEY